MDAHMHVATHCIHRHQTTGPPFPSLLMDAQTPPFPSLPTHLVEHILATAAIHITVEHDPIFSLLNVLPQRVVPVAYAAVVTNAFASDSETEEEISRVLHVLFQDQSAGPYCQRLLVHMKKALVSDTACCLTLITRLLGQTGNLELLKQIADLEGVNVANCMDVVDGAASHGHVHVLEWWCNNQFPMMGFEISSIESAISGGHFMFLQWWHALGCPTTSQAFDFSALIEPMVTQGRLPLLMWWVSNVTPNFVFVPQHWLQACENGHSHILTFAKRRGDPFPGQSVLSDCIDAAAANGHVDVLDWWYDNIGSEGTFVYSVDAMDGASANGHVDVLEWFAMAGLDLRFTPAAIQLARTHGHQAAVDWWKRCKLFSGMLSGRTIPRNVFLRSSTDFVMLCAFGYYSFDISTITSQGNEVLIKALQVACQHGHVSVLSAISQYVDLLQDATYSHIKCAVENNQVAALQWCFRNLPPQVPYAYWWQHSDCVDTAFFHGHVEVLQLLSSAGILNWTRDGHSYVTSACAGGHLRTIEFIVEMRGCASTWPWGSIESAFYSAASNGHIGVLEFLLQLGVSENASAQCDWAKAIDAASNSGHRSVLKWWHQNEHRLPFEFTERALYGAVTKKHQEVIEWWINSGKLARCPLTCNMMRDSLLQLQNSEP